MPSTNEIAPDLFRLSIYVQDFDMQFNHFLHGSSYIGRSDKLLTDSAGVIKENFAGA